MDTDETNTSRLKICNDAAIDNAQHFHFDTFVDTFYEIITNPENKTPFSIVINGRWGSGKTTLMKTLRKKIEESTADEQKRKIKTVWFNAWKYSETDQLLASFVREIYAEMEHSDKWKSMLPVFSEKVNITRVASDLLSTLTLNQAPDISQWKKVPEYEKNLPFYDTFQNYLEKPFSFFELDKKKDDALVIFIDDLDRCSPKAVTNVMETINLFFDQKGCIFVFGMDMNFITKAIGSYYRDYEDFKGEEYLNKMVQLRFNLPDIRENEIRKYIEEDLEIKKPLKDSIDLILIASEGNPRHCKQFVNTLRFMIALSQPSKLDIDDELLIKWSTLNHLDPSFINEIKRNPLLLERLQLYSRYGKNAYESESKEIEKKYSMTEEEMKNQLELFEKYKNYKNITKILKSGAKEFEDIGDYVYLSNIAPVKTGLSISDTIIDSEIYVNIMPGERDDRFKDTDIFTNRPTHFFYHFIVPEGASEWGGVFHTKFYVDGLFVREELIPILAFPEGNYGCYTHIFPKEGKYQIEIRSKNTVEKIIEVKKPQETPEESDIYTDDATS